MGYKPHQHMLGRLTAYCIGCGALSPHQRWWRDWSAYCDINCEQVVWLCSGCKDADTAKDVARWILEKA